MTIRTLYISHSLYDWSDHKSIALNNKNFGQVTKQTPHLDYHASLEDLNIKTDKISSLLDSVETLHLVGLDINFIEVIPDSSLYMYLYFFQQLKNTKTKIVNFEWHDQISQSLFQQLVDNRKTDGKNLWITGCSITHGVGVDLKQRYANILAKKTNLPTTVLTVPGSSIAWQADQLLQSDIRPGDIVVWGLTSFGRVNYSIGYNWTTASLSRYLDIPKNRQYWTIDYFSSLTQSTACIKNILQVSNFCKKMNAELYLVNLSECTWTDFIFSNTEKYLNLIKPFTANGKFAFIDFGTDNSHPGPKQHQEYAENIFNFIKENNHG
jgi:hypothetical protein